ncbi:tyrosine-protein phosphatase [Desulforudis sp. DRI-14]|uniref:tyrosine-protein phosphatase n=1 Tax=Desulforudis sp. DRI-14 TaxID=3459793 RepID=UPI004042B54D
MHAHILPGLDDGARTLEESLAMARELVAQGVRTVVAAPHFMPGVYMPKPEEIWARVAGLQHALNEEGLPLRLAPGAECYLDPELPARLRRGELQTINDTGRYLLVELPMGDYPVFADDVLFELLLSGITPILAHPERNAVLAEHPEKVYDLVRRGVLLQVNAGSLAGLFGTAARSAARLFVRHAWAHFLGSDAHRPGERIAAVSVALNEINSLIGRAGACALAGDRPQAVLEGTECVLPDPDPPVFKPRFSFGRFFGR